MCLNKVYKVLKIKSDLLCENDELPCSMGQETVAHTALLLHLSSIFTTCIFCDDRMYSYQFNLKDFKVYQSGEELLLKVVAGEDYDEERVKVMALYRDTDLQQYKLESQLSLLPEKVQTMIMGSTSLICWTFFSHSELLVNPN